MLHGDQASVLPDAADGATYAVALTIDDPLAILMYILVGSVLERHFKVLNVLACSSEARRLACSTAAALLMGASVASATLTAAAGVAAAHSSQLTDFAAAATQLAQLAFVTASQRANAQQPQQLRKPQQQQPQQQQQQQVPHSG